MARRFDFTGVLVIALWVVMLVGAMLHPFLPGGADALAASIAPSATFASFVALLLPPIGLLWLLTGRGHLAAKLALIVGALVATAAALAMAATASVAAALAILAIAFTWLLRLRRSVSAAGASAGLLPRWVPIALVVVPLSGMAAYFTLAERAEEWSRDRAIAHAADMIGAIERYRERTGAYPAALNSLWRDYATGVVGVDRYRYEPSGDAYNLYFEHPSTVIGTREIVMYNPRGEQDFSSHVMDLLEYSPEQIRRARGHYAAHAMRQANWKRFLFD